MSAYCCPRCHIPARERLTIPCDECQIELEEFKQEVHKGGVLWRCDRGHDGVFPAGGEVASAIREAAEKAGVEYTEDIAYKLSGSYCPACGINPGGTA